MKRAIILATAIILSFNSSAQNAKGWEIDGHNHIVGGGKFANDFPGAARVAIKEMDKYGIKKMLIMPPPFPSTDHKGYYDIEELMEAVKIYPDRFAAFGGGGSLNAMIQEAVKKGKTTPEMKKKFKKRALDILKLGAKGFGEFAIEHLCLGSNHNYQCAPADHPLFLLLADIAAEKGVPIDIHMEAVSKDMPLPKKLKSPPNPPCLSENIKSFEKLLEHNPKATIIWSHIGWGNTGDRTLELMEKLLKKHPNLYMSFKISPADSVPQTRPIKNRGKELKKKWLIFMEKFPDRFFIGTDAFYIAPNLPMKKVGPTKVKPMSKFYSLLPDDLAQKIGSDNPKKILGIDK
jgi:predicted TIM-barrel fold metal-dependent hydrolase